MTWEGPEAGVAGGPSDELVPPLAPPARSDRWAHRRVEPRGLALLWTLYLLAVTLTSFWTPTTGAGLDPLAGRYASRVLLVAVSFGYGVLWPMLRLCQVFPGEGGVASVGKDLLVVVIPTQAVVWPLAFLAVWPMSVAAGLGAITLGWTLLVGALLAVALGPGGVERTRGRWRRAGWMLVIMAVAARPGGLVDGVWGGGWGGGLWEMSSAVSAPLAVTVPPRGRVEWMTPLQWAAVGVTFGVSLGLWLVAAALAGRGPRAPHGESLGGASVGRG